MRKNLVLISFMLVALLACDKEELDPEIAVSEHSSKTLDVSMTMRYLWGTYETAGPPWDLSVWYVPRFCFWPPENCLPTVTIRGREAPEDLDKFLQHIEEGTYPSYFSSNEYKRTFGIVDSFPTFLELLKSSGFRFDVQTSDTLDRHLYVMGFDSNSEIGSREEPLLVFEIDVE